MTIFSASAIFIISFIVMVIASFFLGSALESLSARLHLSRGLLGMIIALGADAPEISSATAALLAKHHDIGIGVVIGSNIFNLAALMGLSAFITGRLRVRRQGLLFNGIVSLIATILISMLLYHVISPWLCSILLIVVLVPYIIADDLRADQINRLRLSSRMRRFLIVAVAHTHHAFKRHKARMTDHKVGIWAAAPSLVIIIFASIGMVRSAVFLSDAWGVSKIIVGMLVIASLTGIPNTITAVKLAIEGEGIAVVSESLNSNTINVLFGILLPVMVLGLNPLSSQTVFSLWWLIGMTIATLYFSFLNKGLNRFTGAVIMCIYLLFALIMIFWK